MILRSTKRLAEVLLRLIAHNDITLVILGNMRIIIKLYQ